MPLPQPFHSSGPTIILGLPSESIREEIFAALSERGYLILEAESGLEAWRLSERHAGAIDLFVADLAMPGMNGRQLPDLLAIHQPRMRVVFTDYASETPAVADADVVCLRGPFSLPELLARVETELLAGEVPLPQAAPTRSDTSRTLEVPLGGELLRPAWVQAKRARGRNSTAADAERNKFSAQR